MVPNQVIILTPPFLDYQSPDYPVLVVHNFCPKAPTSTSTVLLLFSSPRKNSRVSVVGKSQHRKQPPAILANRLRAPPPSGTLMADFSPVCSYTFISPTARSQAGFSTHF